jgi:hypothetical protein
MLRSFGVSLGAWKRSDLGDPIGACMLGEIFPTYPTFAVCLCIASIHSTVWPGNYPQLRLELEAFASDLVHNP